MSSWTGSEAQLVSTVFGGRGGSAAVIGVGETDYSSNSRRSEARLAAEAVTAALADAGIDAGEVDGIVPYPHGPSSETLIASLGLPDVRFTAVPHMGGASSVAALRLAALAVATGQASVVICFVARNGRSRARVESRVKQIVPGQEFREGLEEPQGMTTPAQWYSLMCRRHMHEFGTTRKQLGAVALTMRRHAQDNPRAQMHGRPLTMEDYMAGRPVAEPYLLYDCCLETDGACAVVVAAPKRRRDAATPPIIITAAGEGHPESPDDISNRRDIFSTGITVAAPRVFAAAGMTPADMDAVMVYDCFTFEVIQQLEEAGFCERGGGGPFVASGAIGRDGSLPVNPHGGLLSEGHMAGMNHVAEAVRQLRGDAGARQLDGVRRIAVTGWGDLGDGALAILQRSAP